jgi:hypothetical protein
MRRPALLAAALAALAAACSSPCRDLGNRLCGCVGAGTLRDTCERMIKNQLDAVNPSRSTEDTCDCLMGSCTSPAADVNFCEWIQTDAGKQACGLAYPPTSPDRTAAPAACYACPQDQTLRVDATSGTRWCCPNAATTVTCTGGTCTCS